MSRRTIYNLRMLFNGVASGAVILLPSLLLVIYGGY